MAKPFQTGQPVGRGMNSTQAVLTVAAMLVLAVLLLPCVVKILPEIYFDVDPRSEAGLAPKTSLGPGGAAWLHVACVGVAAVAIAVSLWAGGRIRWVSCGLVGLGMAACAYQMRGRFEDLLQGGAWIGAAALALAVLHLAQHEAPRRWMFAAMVAILVPLSLQAIWYVWVEHPETVRHFEDTQAEMLTSRGWVEGSTQHRLYSRRVRGSDAIGTFGLSNVLGSIVVSLTMLSLAATAGLLIVRSCRRWAAAPAVLSALGLWTVVLTQSKGAMLTAGAALGVLALGAQRRGSSRVATLLPFAAMALLAAVIGAVLLRPLAGPPESPEGELSMLFRYYYWQGAARIVAHDMPRSLVLGVGPSGFHEGYLWAKNPFNPEEVTAAHSVFVDYGAMLGLGGWAWCGALLSWLWTAGRGVFRAGMVDHHGEPSAAGDAAWMRQVRLVVALAVVIFGVQLLMKFPVMALIGQRLIWVCGLIGFIWVAAVVGNPRFLSPRWRAAGLFAAAVAVLLHNQIEMAFFHASSAAIVWGIVALAGGSVAADSRRRRVRARWLEVVPPVAMVVVAVAMAFGYAGRVWAHQSHLSAAAQALRQSSPHRAIERLDQAAAVVPTDPRTTRWRVALRLEGASVLAEAGHDGVAERWIGQALEVLDEAQSHNHDAAVAQRLRSGVYETAAKVFNDPNRLMAAANALERVIELNPYGLQDHLHLADLCWQLEEYDRARRYYRRALRISDDSYLDHDKQISAQDRDRVERRLSANGG